MRLSLKEAAFGAEARDPAQHPGPCDTCDGSGAEGGKRMACPRCKGTGQITHARGSFLLQTLVPATARAWAARSRTPCKKCRGSGQVDVDRTVKVTFPAGIDDGQTLRVPEQGLAGTQGGPAGHLYVDVAVEPDPRFQREGYDLVHEVELSFPQAALGAEVDVPRLDDERDQGRGPRRHAARRDRGRARQGRPAPQRQRPRRPDWWS